MEDLAVGERVDAHCRDRRIGQAFIADARRFPAGDFPAELVYQLTFRRELPNVIWNVE